MKNLNRKMQNDNEKRKMEKSKMFNFKFYIAIFTFSFLLFNFAHAQTQFIHISWKVTDAPYEHAVKNLPVNGSQLIVGATYNIVEDGRKLSDADFKFTWSMTPKRDYLFPDGPAFAIPIELFPGGGVIEFNLQMRSKAGGGVYRKSIQIPVARPEATLLRYDRALDLSFPFSGQISRSFGSFDIIARPFYFTLGSVGRSELSIVPQYRWNFDGQFLEGSVTRPEIISLDVSRAQAGAYRLALHLSNAAKKLQYMTKIFTINVTE